MRRPALQLLLPLLLLLKVFEAKAIVSILLNKLLSPPRVYPGYYHTLELPPPPPPPLPPIPVHPGSYPALEPRPPIPVYIPTDVDDSDYWADYDDEESLPRNCSCQCGVANYEKRIVGGRPTGVNRYPWVARIFYDRLTQCGGSLLNADYVLTAAHCVYRSTTH